MPRSSLQAFYLFIFRSPPKPAGADGYIRLGGDPEFSAADAFVLGLPLGPFDSGNKTLGVVRGPGSAAGHTPFIAHPSASGARVSENDGIGLQLEDGFVVQGPVIFLAFSVGTFPAGAVEPLLKHGTVAAQGAPERLFEYLIVFRRAVMGVEAVPGRDVNAQFESVLRAGLRQVFQHVSLSVFPGRLLHGMPAHRIGPEAEAVVVLGREDDSLEAGITGHLCPLAAVHVRGIEDVLRFGPVPPLFSGEGVGAEVDEQIGFHPLPLHLGGCGAGAIGGGGFHGAGGGQQGGGQQGNVFHIKLYHCSHSKQRAPSGRTVMCTLRVSSGKRPSMFSGHSIRQSSPESR